MTSADLPEFPAKPGEASRSDVSLSPKTDARRQSRNSRLRFLQASDFRLDTPCFGISRLPERFRDPFVNARYLAAQRVFDAAIEECVDFLILAGGLLDASLPGLRGPWFLVEQFRRLARAGIDVYWAGASVETRGRWPAHLDLPANVHRLGSDGNGILHGYDGTPSVRLLSLPSCDGAQVPRAEVLTIAVQPRCSDMPRLAKSPVAYWALGGMTEEQTAQEGSTVAHFSGSPQGRSPAEPGRHSCSLVEVDREGRITIQPVLTDVVRWHQKSVSLAADDTWSALEERLRQLQQEVSVDPRVELHLMTWNVTGGGLTLQRLLQPHARDELIGRLNGTSGSTSSRIWTAGIRAVADPRQQAQWQLETTPLGAFLRELDEMAEHVGDLFGVAASGPHPLGAGQDSDEELVRHVVNEGIHRLGAADGPARNAG